MLKLELCKLNFCFACCFLIIVHQQRMMLERDRMQEWGEETGPSLCTSCLVSYPTMTLHSGQGLLISPAVGSSLQLLSTPRSHLITPSLRAISTNPGGDLSLRSAAPSPKLLVLCTWTFSLCFSTVGVVSASCTYACFISGSPSCVSSSPIPI